MTKRTRLWEDRPRGSAKTREEVEETWVMVQKAIKFFWCELCGAEKGEPCKSTDDDFLTPSEIAWHEDWDAHAPRTSRWIDATELERAMLEAVDEKE